MYMYCVCKSINIVQCYIYYIVLGLSQHWGRYEQWLMYL